MEQQVKQLFQHRGARREHPRHLAGIVLEPVGGGARQIPEPADLCDLGGGNIHPLAKGGNLVTRDLAVGLCHFCGQRNHRHGKGDAFRGIVLGARRGVGAYATTGRLGVVAHWPAAEAARALEHAEASGPVYVAPNGAVFAGPAAREGALPRMLREVLAARFLTKQALKRARAARRGTLARVLDARQLALKLVANVTYGYCAASFSGRQPCADLADAIVASGRSCLEDAVGVAGGAGAANPVKYGDTDSIFVEMAGASVAQALDRAHEISKTVFAGTPPAVHLKVEYVFDGCALVSKKRYVGRAVEAPGDTPHLLVKGLELKTRDQCDFVRERLEAVVRDVLATRDLSRAKRTLQRAVVGVEACPLQDLILWRRYRGEGAYKTNRHDLVGPVKELDARGNRTAAKDRVGYVVVKDPGLKLYQRTHAATHEAGLALRVDRTFYIKKKLLPPLSRILDVCGVNVFALSLIHI